MIVTGGGGVGKSYLIRTISKWIVKVLLKKADPNTTKVILLAYTGAATSLIGATTFHSGLGFNFGSKNYLPVSREKLDKIKKELESVEVAIVDEMSMVSVDLLYKFHKRLMEIFNSDDDFGGRTIY